MSKGKKFLLIATYLLLAMILFFQIIGLLSVITRPNALPIALRERKGIVPTWVASLVLTITAFILYKAGKSKEKLLLWTMIIAIVAAVLNMVVSLALRAAFPLQAAASNVSRNGVMGLDGWRLFWRHYSVSIVGVVVAILSFINRKAIRSQRLRAEDEGYQAAFTLGEDPLFADEETEADTRNKKLSKKQRKALKEHNGN